MECLIPTVISGFINTIQDKDISTHQCLSVDDKQIHRQWTENQSIKWDLKMIKGLWRRTCGRDYHLDFNLFDPNQTRINNLVIACESLLVGQDLNRKLPPLGSHDHTTRITTAGLNSRCSARVRIHPLPTYRAPEVSGWETEWKPNTRGPCKTTGELVDMDRNKLTLK